MFVQDGTVAATMRIYPAQQHQGLAWYVQHREETATAACSVHLEALTVYSVGSIWSVPAAASL